VNRRSGGGEGRRRQAERDKGRRGGGVDAESREGEREGGGGEQERGVGRRAWRFSRSGLREGVFAKVHGGDVCKIKIFKEDLYQQY